MSKKEGKRQDLTNLDSPRFFSRREFLLFKKFLEFLKQKESLDLVKGVIQKEGIPISIFNTKLSALESIVKYFREEKEYGYKRIGEILKRNAGPIGVTYRNAFRKFAPRLDISDTRVIPFSIFTSKLTVFESIVAYLKDERKLSFSEIAKILKRDYRTVWTVYSRTRRKHAGR